jgi:hypothetical protein
MSFIASGLGIAALAGVEGAADAALLAAGGEAIGAGVGALTNPKNRLKGALLGGVTGAAGGALGAGLGALGGEAAGAVGSEGADAAEQGALNVAKGAAQNESFNALTSGTAAEGAPTLVEPGGNLATNSTASNLLSSPVTKMVGGQAVNVAGSAMNPPPSYGNQGAQTIAGAKQQGQEEANSTYKSWAHGGSIRLENNSFIIPADVVSAIGNGSTKAGAKYLDHLFAAIAAGPPPKAGSLAKQRAKERQKA